MFIPRAFGLGFFAVRRPVLRLGGWLLSAAPEAGRFLLAWFRAPGIPVHKQETPWFRSKGSFKGDIGHRRAVLSILVLHGDSWD